jgi:hypothetical protein
MSLAGTTVLHLGPDAVTRSPAISTCFRLGSHHLGDVLLVLVSHRCGITGLLFLVEDVVDGLSCSDIHFTCEQGGHTCEAMQQLQGQ